MLNYTAQTYQMKREIFNFTGKISKGLFRPARKFLTDMCYGMMASGSCLLTEVAQKLHEDAKKIKVVDRLSKHLARGRDERAEKNYLDTVEKWLPQEPVVVIDDSDVAKPEGKHFESLGWVRDGSASTKKHPVIVKGYHVTEACVATEKMNHPVSIFSEVHSATKESNPTSKEITFAAIDRAVSLRPKCTFVMDRGYDDNEIIKKLLGIGQDFVIRMMRNRKFFFHNRWIFAPELCNRRRGRINMNVRYKGKEYRVKLSHVQVRITGSDKVLYLVLVYGISEHPMMLLTNIPVLSKEDVKRIAKIYCKRWKIEEYFKAKKQMFDFENFRVRSLSAINALNFCITVCMAFLAQLILKKHTCSLYAEVISAAQPIKKKVNLEYYRIAYGIRELLSFARQGMKAWFKPLRTDPLQLRIKLPS